MKLRSFLKENRTTSNIKCHNYEILKHEQLTLPFTWKLTIISRFEADCGVVGVDGVVVML